MIDLKPPTDEEQYGRLKSIKSQLVCQSVVQLDSYREVLKIQKELLYRLEKARHH